MIDVNKLTKIQFTDGTVFGRINNNKADPILLAMIPMSFLINSNNEVITSLCDYMTSASAMHYKACAKYPKIYYSNITSAFLLGSVGNLKSVPDTDYNIVIRPTAAIIGNPTEPYALLSNMLSGFSGNVNLDILHTNILQAIEKQAIMIICYRSVFKKILVDGLSINESIAKTALNDGTIALYLL